MQLGVILYVIRLYANEFSSKMNDDGTIAELSSYNLGEWHMVNFH